MTALINESIKFLCLMNSLLIYDNGDVTLVVLALIVK